MNKLILAVIIAGIFFSCQKPSLQVIEPEPGISNTSSARTVVASPLQWQKCFGSALTEMGFAVTRSINESGYVLAGNTLGNNGNVSGNHGGSDAWIVHIGLNGNVVWQKCFGGTLGDYAYDITATSDGGYIFCGATSSNDGDVSGLARGGVDAWVAKISASGIMEWQKVFGGTGTERAMNINQTNDGYVVAGYTNSNNGDLSGMNHGGNDGWIMKLGSAGEILWNKTYGGSQADDIGDVLSLSDGNLLVSAGTRSNDGDLIGTSNHGAGDAWLFKIDGSNGNMITGWNRTYGGSNDEGNGTVFTTSDGGYVFSTSTSSNNGDVTGNHGYVDTWVVKLDANGNKQWQKCFGGFDMDNARVRHIDASGNLVVVGYTFSRNGDIPGSKGGEDMWVMRLDANGNKLYSNVLGGKGGDMSNDAVATADGMYISAGRSSSNNGDVSGNQGREDMWVVKFKF